MRNRYRSVFGTVCLSLMLLIGPGAAQETSKRAATTGSSLAPPIVKRLDEVLTRTRDTIEIPGVIVSVDIPGEGLWERAIGVGDKSTGEAMKAGMHTRIGSLTKTFTVTALLMLVDDGLIKLDDPVSNYLDFVPNGENITLRQLANMTSGLYSYTQVDSWAENLFAFPYQVFTARELVDVGFTMEPRFAPGTSINYCNSNTVLLGMVIEKVSGQPIEEVLAKRIFEPLKLNNTSWPDGTDLPAPFAHGYTKQTPDGTEADSTFHNPSWGNAAGQMVSDLGDLKVWGRVLGEGTLLKPETQAERLTWAPFGSPTLTYGLGIGGFHGWLGHTGTLPGYNTGVFYLPSKRALIVIQANSDIPHIVDPKDPNVKVTPVPALFREIAKIISPENVPDGVDFLPDEQSATSK